MIGTGLNATPTPRDSTCPMDSPITPPTWFSLCSYAGQRAFSITRSRSAASAAGAANRSENPLCDPRRYPTAGPPQGVALGYGGGSGGGAARWRDAVRTALLATLATRVPIAMPSTTLMSAVAIFDAVDASAANGMMVATSVTSPMVQPKNRIGRGVVTINRWTRPTVTGAGSGLNHPSRMNLTQFADARIPDRPDATPHQAHRPDGVMAGKLGDSRMI